MSSTNIAVISDLHIGKLARAKDLCPNEKDGPTVDNTYQQKFFDFIDQNDDIFSDYLIIPGDVTNESQFEEIKLASEFISTIARKLKVSDDKIIFVPGNHDVDWKVLKIGNDPLRLKQRYDPLCLNDFIFCKLMAIGEGHVLHEPYMSYYESDNLIVVSYNSSWHDSPQKAMHYGILDDNHIPKIEKYFDSVKTNNSKIKVFLVHHHPIGYSNPVPGELNFSQMQNSEQLFRLLDKGRFDFLIHGHIHQPRFKVQTLDCSKPLGIFSAGSFSFTLPIEWNGVINNQFHLIKIDGRDPETQNVQGKIESWAYYFGTGWIESEPHRDGISHEEPFGVYLTHDQIMLSLEDVIKNLFTKNDWIDKEMLLSAFPKLMYLRPNRVLDVLDELSEKIHFKRVYDNLNKVVLLKLKEDN